eukprot:TRINITY_DN14777_c0_g1_i1.p1 TRINITY_DN14777_c0_g1~~TRINITY_DN14777_c0_g1_i1.p1  ORF type:complete len:326 (+),score=54.32 TRINITY_DN14777_c0_g1_i1:40-978(+)
MSKLSSSEQAFVENGAADNIRVDGRTRMELRHLAIQCGVMENSYGSARVCLGGTEVLCCVGAEVGDTQNEAGRLEVYVTGTPGSTKSLGKAARQKERTTEAFNASLAHQLKQILGASEPEAANRGMSEVAPPKEHETQHNGCRVLGIDYTELFIRDTKCWVVTVDIMVLNNEGNCITAATVGCRAALTTARLPKVVIHEDIAGDEGLEISGNPSDAEPIPGAHANLPICITSSLIGQQVITDPCLLEESCPLATYYIGVTPSLQITSITSSLRNPETYPRTADVSLILSTACGMARTIFQNIDEQIKAQENA